MKKHSLLIQIIGWSGTIVLIGAYALNSFGVLPSQGLVYPILNLYAAIALGIRVWADKNMSNLILEIFWGGVAVAALLSFIL
jgi:phage-related minor tail protein